MKKIDIQRVKFALVFISVTVVTVVFKRVSLTNNDKMVSPPPPATCFIKNAEYAEAAYAEAENVSIQDTHLENVSIQDIPLTEIQDPPELSSSAIHFIQSNLTIQEPYYSSISNYPFPTPISNSPFATITDSMTNSRAVRKVTGRILEHFKTSPQSAFIKRYQEQFISMVAARWSLQSKGPFVNPLLPTRAEPAQALSEPVARPSSRAEMPSSSTEKVLSISRA